METPSNHIDHAAAMLASTPEVHVLIDTAYALHSYEPPDPRALCASEIVVLSRLMVEPTHDLSRNAIQRSVHVGRPTAKRALARFVAAHLVAAFPSQGGNSHTYAITTRGVSVGRDTLGHLMGFLPQGSPLGRLAPDDMARAVVATRALALTVSTEALLEIALAGSDGTTHDTVATSLGCAGRSVRHALDDLVAAGLVVSSADRPARLRVTEAGTARAVRLASAAQMSQDVVGLGRGAGRRERRGLAHA